MLLQLSAGYEPVTRMPFLAATLPGVEHAFDFYGAGVGRMRLGGGEPSLSLLPNIEAWLTCVFGTADPFNSC